MAADLRERHSEADELPQEVDKHVAQPQWSTERGTATVIEDDI